MAGQQSYEVRVAASAFNDIADIWEWTVQRFGHAAALRYEALIEQAIADLADDPAPRRQASPGLVAWPMGLPSGLQPLAWRG